MNVNSKSDHVIEKFLHQYVYDTTCKTEEKNVTRLLSIKQPYVHSCTRSLNINTMGKRHSSAKSISAHPRL